MNIPKEKFELVRQQVIAKIHWGTGDAEVMEWLAEKWAIGGTMAENLLAEAHIAKRKAMRSKALQRLAVSGTCLLAVGIYLGVQHTHGKLELSGLVIVAALVGLVSLAMFIPSLLQVMRGEEAGPAD